MLRHRGHLSAAVVIRMLDGEYGHPHFFQRRYAVSQADKKGICPGCSSPLTRCLWVSLFLYCPHGLTAGTAYSILALRSLCLHRMLFPRIMRTYHGFYPGTMPGFFLCTGCTGVDWPQIFPPHDAFRFPMSSWGSIGNADVVIRTLASALVCKMGSPLCQLRSAGGFFYPQGFNAFRRDYVAKYNNNDKLISSPTRLRSIK
jgi:hypothetical protein